MRELREEYKHDRCIPHVDPVSAGHSVSIRGVSGGVGANPTLPANHINFEDRSLDIATEGTFGYITGAFSPNMFNTWHMARDRFRVGG